MRTKSSWFAEVLHRRKAPPDSDVMPSGEAGPWAVEPQHPIDGAALALMVGPSTAPEGSYKDIYGNFVLVAVFPREALLNGAVQYEAGLLLRLPGDSIGDHFDPGGEDSLTLQVEWLMERLTGGMKACPPPLTTIRAKTHQLAQNEYALQFIGEESASTPDNLFAPPTGDSFACVESVTFGVPLRSQNPKLVLTFPMDKDAIAAGVMKLRKEIRHW